MDQPAPCPSAAELAAFLDGTLEPGRRSALLVHLADCETCTAILADASAVKADLRQNPDPVLRLSGSKSLAQIVQLHSRRPEPVKPPRRWMGAAALVLLALGVALLWPSHRAAGGFPTASEAAAALAETADLRPLTLQLWPGEGGALGFGGVLTPARTSFRMGVLLVDLQVCAAAGDWQRAGDVTQRMAPLVSGAAETQALDGLRAALAHGDASATAAQASALAEALAGRLPAQPAAFGRWTESGRLAAIGRTPGFLEKAEVRAFPHEIVASASAPVARELRRIDGLLRRAPQSEADFAALARSFEQVLLLE